MVFQPACAANTPMFLISLHISCQAFYSYLKKQSMDFCTSSCCCSDQNKSKQVCAHPSVTNTMRFSFSLWWIVILNAQLLLSVTSASAFLFHLPITLRAIAEEATVVQLQAHPSRRNPMLGSHVWAFVCVCGQLAATCPRPPWQDARERGQARSSALSQGDRLSHSTRSPCTMHTYVAWTQMLPQL